MRTERAEPLEILDRCRIRWGTVVAVTGESAVVTSQPLQWDGHRLFFGLERPETVNLGSDGLSLVVRLPGGDGWPIDFLSSDGGHWTRTGVPPRITTSPSVNMKGVYHGWIRDGVITEDCEGRKFAGIPRTA